MDTLISRLTRVLQLAGNDCGDTGIFTMLIKLGSAWHSLLGISQLIGGTRLIGILLLVSSSERRESDALSSTADRVAAVASRAEEGRWKDVAEDRSEQRKATWDASVSEVNRVELRIPVPDTTAMVTSTDPQRLFSAMSCGIWRVLLSYRIDSIMTNSEARQTL